MTSVLELNAPRPQAPAQCSRGRPRGPFHSILRKGLWRKEATGSPPNDQDENPIMCSEQRARPPLQRQWAILARRALAIQRGGGDFVCWVFPGRALPTVRTSTTTCKVFGTVCVCVFTLTLHRSAICLAHGSLSRKLRSARKLPGAHSTRTTPLSMMFGAAQLYAMRREIDLRGSIAWTHHTIHIDIILNTSSCASR